MLLAESMLYYYILLTMSTNKCLFFPSGVSECRYIKHDIMQNIFYENENDTFKF